MGLGSDVGSPPSVLGVPVALCLASCDSTAAGCVGCVVGSGVFGGNGNVALPELELGCGITYCGLEASANEPAARLE